MSWGSREALGWGKKQDKVTSERREEGGILAKGEGRKDLEQQGVGPQINFLT